jgi:uncharacterized protein
LAKPLQLRKLALAFVQVTSLLIVGVYVWAMPLFHYDTVTFVALHPTRLPLDAPRTTNDFPCKIEPVSIPVPKSKGTVTLDGIMCRVANSKKLAIYSHGNAGTIDSRTPHYPTKALVEAGYSVLLYDYEGFGRSQGEADYRHPREDGLAAYDWAIAQGYKPQDILLYGESFGGGVACEIARARPAAALILDNTFISPERWCKERLPAANIYPHIFMPTPYYDNLDYMRGKHLPCLIISGRCDDTIPPQHSEAMAAAGGANTWIVRLPDSPHCGVVETDRQIFEGAFKSFMLQLKKGDDAK